jgi:hypothetical protein
VSAYANDPRVTPCGGAGFEVAVVTPSGREMTGRVRPVGDRWESYWADGEPMKHMHDTADEGIDSFLSAEAILRQVAR